MVRRLLSKTYFAGISPLNKSILIAYVLAIALFLLGDVINAGFDSLNHIFSILALSSFLGFAAMGQTLVILTGGIDLSIPYVLNAGAVFMTGLIATQHIPADWAVLLVLIGGGFVGAINGLGVAYLGIPPLVMTLGMNSVMEGVVLVYTNGTPTGGAPKAINSMVNGHLGMIPTEILIWLVFALIIGVLLYRTTFGRRVYAVGNSIISSYLSGVKISIVLIGVYALSGMFAVLTGMLLTAFAGESYLGMGDSYLLPSIAAVVIGGASILGGSGKYTGTIAGAIILTVLGTLLTILNMPSAARDILYGVVILVALLVNRLQYQGRDLVG